MTEEITYFWISGTTDGIKTAESLANALKKDASASGYMSTVDFGWNPVTKKIDVFECWLVLFLDPVDADDKIAFVMSHNDDLCEITQADARAFFEAKVAPACNII